MSVFDDVFNKLNELRRELEEITPILQNGNEENLYKLQCLIDFAFDRLQSEFVGIVTNSEINNILNALNTMLSYMNTYKTTKNTGYLNNVINQIPGLKSSFNAIPISNINNAEIRKLASECKQARDINNKAIKEFQTEQKKLNDKTKDLTEKTAKLLSDATTGILSKEFENKRIAELITYKSNTRWFWGIIIAIVLVLVFGDRVTNWLFDIGNTGNPLQIGLRFLARLSITAPLIWLAVVQNKKMNLSKKLAEEYWHKEVVAKTFVGLADQIDKNTEGETAKDLRIKLLNVTLDTIAKDPADCIGNHNDSDNPMRSVSKKGLKKVNEILDTAIKAKDTLAS